MDRASLSASVAADSRALHRSAMVQLLCGLYGLMLVVMAIVFSVAAAVTHRRGDDTLYLEALQVYVFVMSLAFLAYLHAHILRHRHASHVIETEPEVGEKNTEKIDLEELEGVDGNCKGQRSRSTSPALVPPPPAKVVYPPPGVTFDAEDVNFYLRLGAIAFGIGSMVQDGFRLAQLIKEGQLTFRCLGPLNIVVVLLHITFTFFQTFYIFKSHKIVVHQQKCVVRFGFVHLMATNVCVWICTTVSEIQTDCLVAATAASPTLTTVTTAAPNTTCEPEESLSWKASPYLYPCTIQYSLVAVVVISQMYRNIGRVHIRHVDEPRDDVSTIRGGDSLAVATPLDSVAVDCDKAHRGLFLGLFVLVLTLVSVSCYFVIGDHFYIGTEFKFYSSFILFFTELALLAFSSSAIVLGFAKFRQLRFHLIDADCMETSLLIVALTGVFLLKCFHTVSAVAYIRTPGDVEAILSVCTSAAVFLQASLQTIFIFDGLRRTVHTPGQHHRKPGRTIITFLLLCNVSLLVVSIFEVKKSENQSIHTETYGYLAWSIISHVTVPMMIFFRFHSSVCLSDIWNSAYKLKDK